MKSAAPRLKQSTTVRGSLCPERKTTGTSRVRGSAWRPSSKPIPPSRGIARSASTRSGTCAWMRAAASVPSSASSMSQSRPSSSVSAVRVEGSSSTMRSTGRATRRSIAGRPLSDQGDWSPLPARVTLSCCGSGSRAVREMSADEQATCPGVANQFSDLRSVLVDDRKKLQPTCSSTLELHPPAAPEVLRRRFQVELPPHRLPGPHLHPLVVLERREGGLELFVARVGRDRATEDGDGLVPLLHLLEAPGVDRPDQAFLLPGLDRTLERLGHRAVLLALVVQRPEHRLGHRIARAGLGEVGLGRGVVL